MSELAVRCEDLPVREEALSGAMLAQVQGGGVLRVLARPTVLRRIKQVGETIGGGILYDHVKAGYYRAKGWCEDQWEEYQAEAEAEALTEARHEMRHQYWNKRG
jgi:hypothetical protein